MTPTAEIKDSLLEIRTKIDQLLRDIEDPFAFTALPKMIEITDRDYAVSKYPVTVGQYAFYIAEANQPPMPKQPEGSAINAPVVSVSLHEAETYCNWLSERTGEHYRLPTEDEFEHYAGNHEEATPEIAAVRESAIPAVGTKKPNNYGLYDILGCVWEWTKSPYASSAEVFATRGGCWAGKRAFSNQTRGHGYPHLGSVYRGFRVLCTRRTRRRQGTQASKVPCARGAS